MREENRKIKPDPVHSSQFTSLDYSAYLEEWSVVLVRRLLTYHATPSPIKRPPTRSWAIPQFTSDSLTRSNTPPALAVGSFFCSDVFPASASGVGVDASFSIPAVKYQHILSHVQGPPGFISRMDSKQKARSLDLGPIVAYIFLS